jgi:hypothetical protein
MSANTNEHSISAEDANDAIAVQKDNYSFPSGIWGGDSNATERHFFNSVEHLQIQCYSSHPEVYAMAELNRPGFCGGSYL